MFWVLAPLSDQQCIGIGTFENAWLAAHKINQIVHWLPAYIARLFKDTTVRQFQTSASAPSSSSATQLNMANASINPRQPV